MTTQANLDTAEGRYAYASTHTTEQYNAAMKAHTDRQTVDGISVVQSRFGTLYVVDGGKLAFYTRAEAEAHLRA